MLAALPADWREKVLKEQHKTLPTDNPLDGLFSPHEGLKTPVLDTFDRAWSKEERLETEKSALAKKSQKTESSAQVAASLFASSSWANTCLLAQQGPRPRSATPLAARQSRSGSGGRGRNEGKPKVHPSQVRWCTRCGQDDHRVAGCPVDRASVHCSSCDVDGHVVACCGTRLAEKNPSLVEPLPGWESRQPYQKQPTYSQKEHVAHQQDRLPSQSAYYARQNNSWRRSPSPRRRSPGRRSPRGRSPRWTSPGGTRLRRASPSPVRPALSAPSQTTARTAETTLPPPPAQDLEAGPSTPANQWEENRPYAAFTASAALSKSLPPLPIRCWPEDIRGNPSMAYRKGFDAFPVPDTGCNVPLVSIDFVKRHSLYVHALNAAQKKRYQVNMGDSKDVTPLGRTIMWIAAKSAPNNQKLRRRIFALVMPSLPTTSAI